MADVDPNLALAGLRIELEKKLEQLAANRGISIGRGGIAKTLRLLNARQLINGPERAVLSDLTILLNTAVHGASVDPRSAAWAIDQGVGILEALEERIQDPDGRYETVT